MRDWNGFFEHVRERGGSFALPEGADFGLSATVLRSRAGREGWPTVAPGAHRLPWMPEPEADFLAGLSAVRAAFQESITFGRRSAAYAHGMLSWYPTAPDFVRKHAKRTPVPELGTGWRSRSIREDQVEQWNGFWITARPRTAVDLGAVLSVKAERNVLIQGNQAGWFTYAAVAELNKSMGNHPGRNTVALALEEAATSRADSGFELDVQRAVAAFGLPPPAPRFPFLCPDGVVVHLDLAWPDRWVALECDGRHHQLDQVFETDRVRWRESSAGGWDLSWTTRPQFRDDPYRILRDVAMRLERADPNLPPAPRHTCPTWCRSCSR